MSEKFTTMPEVTSNMRRVFSPDEFRAALFAPVQSSGHEPHRNRVYTMMSAVELARSSEAIIAVAHPDDMLLDVAGLSVRGCNALSKESVHTVGDLRRYVDRESGDGIRASWEMVLIRLPGFGRLCLEQAMEILRPDIVYPKSERGVTATGMSTPMKAAGLNPISAAALKTANIFTIADLKKYFDTNNAYDRKSRVAALRSVRGIGNGGIKSAIDILERTSPDAESNRAEAPTQHESQSGSLRDQIAIAVLPALVGNHDVQKAATKDALEAGNTIYDQIAHHAYQYADAMLRQRCEN